MNRCDDAGIIDYYLFIYLFLITCPLMMNTYFDGVALFTIEVAQPVKLDYMLVMD